MVGAAEALGGLDAVELEVGRRGLREPRVLRASGAPLASGLRRRRGRVGRGVGGAANFRGLVLGCIEAKFCRKICV